MTSEEFEKPERIAPRTPSIDAHPDDKASPDQTRAVEQDDFRRNTVDNWRRIGLSSWRPTGRSVSR